VTVKIGLKQEEEEEEEVVTEALLDSGAIELVMSEKFAKKHRFRRTKLERLIYVRNVDSMLNYAGPIVDTCQDRGRWTLFLFSLFLEFYFLFPFLFFFYF